MTHAKRCSKAGGSPGVAGSVLVYSLELFPNTYDPDFGVMGNTMATDIPKVLLSAKARSERKKKKRAQKELQASGRRDRAIAGRNSKNREIDSS